MTAHPTEPNQEILAYHQEQQDRLARHIEGSPHRTYNADLEQLKTATTVITAPMKRDYLMPNHFKKTMAPKLLKRLGRLMAELWSFRTQLVGLTEGEAAVLYNGDPFVLLLTEEFKEVAVEHLQARLARRSPRDQGHPIRKFLRLKVEFTDWWGAFGTSPGTGHSLVLARVSNHLYWRLYKETMGRLVVHNEDGKYQIDSVDHDVCGFIDHFLHLSGYHLGTVITSTAIRYPAVTLQEAETPDRPLEELRCMAADLMEVQGRLIRSYRPENNIIEVADGVFAGWSWATEHRAGVVFIGETLADVRRQTLTQAHVQYVGIGFDGLPSELLMPFRRFESDATVRFSLGLLRPIHRRLVSEWLRLGPLPRELAADDGEASDVEAISMAAEAIVEDDQEDSGPWSSSAPRVRVPAVRTNRLLGVLQRQFGCEVSRGKGSEITVFRKGGHIYTLPGHKRNTHYPTWMIRALLKTVGITPREFATVICKRVQTH